MNRHLPVTFIFIAVIFYSCGSSKKSAGTSATSQSSSSGAAEIKDNPTLKKASYKRIDNQTFQLEGVSSDTTYGYSPKNAIKVGDGGGSGPSNERSYLNALLGPDGQKVTYNRIGGCCPVESKNGFMGMAMLDKYEVTYSGLGKTIYLYINMYDPGKLYAPAGFTFKK